MKIAVIGACGRTGALVCQEAIRRGHDVTGLSRSRCSDLDIRFVIGDALYYNAIEEAIKGQDVIISTLGHVKLGEKHTQTEAIKNVISAMQKTGVQKIVSLTGSGVRVEGDKISLIDRILNIPLKIVDKSRVEDGIEHYEELKKSSLDWTVLRVLKLTNSDTLQKYALTPGGPAKTLVSRKTVASAMLDLAESDDWSQKAPVIS